MSDSIVDERLADGDELVGDEFNHLLSRDCSHERRDGVHLASAKPAHLLKPRGKVIIKRGKKRRKKPIFCRQIYMDKVVGDPIDRHLTGNERAIHMTPQVGQILLHNVR